MKRPAPAFGTWLGARAPIAGVARGPGTFRRPPPPSHGRPRPPRRSRLHRLGRDAPRRHRARPRDRVQRGRPALRDGPPPQRRPRRLADGPPGRGGPGLHQPEAVRGPVLPPRHPPGHDAGVLRRQVELVGRLRLLDVQDVRPRRLPGHGRRPGQVGGRGPDHDHDDADLREHRLHRGPPRPVHPRVPRRRPAPHEGGRPDGRRPEPPGVHRRDLARAGQPPVRVGAPGRPHPRRAQRPVEPGRQRRRHVQVARRAGRDLPRRAGPRPQGRDGRLLPDRRAVEPHLVRAQVPARASRPSATTTARGPSGATWSACPSRRACPRTTAASATDAAVASDGRTVPRPPEAGGQTGPPPRLSSPLL